MRAGVAPPAGAAASGAGGAVPSPRPRLERQDSARTPGWMAKPRPGSQRPERDDDVPLPSFPLHHESFLLSVLILISAERIV